MILSYLLFLAVILIESNDSRRCLNPYMNMIATGFRKTDHEPHCYLCIDNSDSSSIRIRHYYRRDICCFKSCICSFMQNSS